MFAVVGEYTLQEIQSDRTGLNERLTDRVCKTLDGYGVRVLQTQLTEFAPCRALAIKGQVAMGQYTLWSGF
jgi:regulator of protease activity HflC (stomatin/prohibitin superfamily)